MDSKIESRIDAIRRKAIVANRKYEKSLPIRVTMDGISGMDICKMMRRSRTTIALVAAFLNVTQTDVRRWRANGLSFIDYLSLAEACRGERGLMARESAGLRFYRENRMA